MKRSQLLGSRIGTALLFLTDFARSSFSRESFGQRRKWGTLAGIALLVLPAVGLHVLSRELIAGGEAIAPSAAGILYVVDSTGDGGNVGNNTICDDGTGHCTLRAAIEAANSHVGNDGISFNIPTAGNNCDASGNCTINLGTALQDLSDNVTITGPGPDKLTVRRAFTAPTFRIFNVTTTGTVNLSGLTISEGGSLGSGIQNFNTGIVNVTNCVLSLNGSAGNVPGGGISNQTTGTVNVTNSILSQNASGNVNGGGISNLTGTVHVTNSTLSFNFGGPGGGGISNVTGTVNVTNSTLSDNSVGQGSNGGGILNQGSGSVTLLNCTLSGNHAGPSNPQFFHPIGGGIFNQGTGTVTVINSTLSGNTANSGGGIWNDSTGTVNLSNSTVSANSASGNAGGINNNSTGPFKVKSSIVALNTAGGSGPDVMGTFTSQGFNLIGRNNDAATSFPAGNPNANNDIVGTGASGVDPKLDPNGLQNNGGPTRTIALRFGSPAIDKGSSEVQPGLFLLTDQRGTGFPRTFDDPAIPNATGGDGTDIGAFEVQTAAPTPTPTPTPGASPTPTATPTTLANISTRLRVETGDNALIGGFIVTGAQPKRVIVRAIGPSLSSFFTGALADPVLELHGPGAFATITNDNWRSTQEAEIIATGIPPSNDLESAIVATLPANSSAYTAIVRGVNNGTGIGLVEAYDLDRSVDSKLANISTRGFVQTGDNVLIGGLIVLGQNPLRVIVRAIGPSLPVPGALGDPTLELYDGNGALIASNDNWRSDQEAEIIATTIPPTNDLESAIVRTLSPAAYTAIVRGVNNTTGVALVEVYALN